MNVDIAYNKKETESAGNTNGPMYK